MPSRRLKTSFTTMGFSLMSFGRAWITSFYRGRAREAGQMCPREALTLSFAPSLCSLRAELPPHLTGPDSAPASSHLSLLCVTSWDSSPTPPKGGVLSPTLYTRRWRFTQGDGVMGDNWDPHLTEGNRGGEGNGELAVMEEKAELRLTPGLTSPGTCSQSI